MYQIIHATYWSVKFNKCNNIPYYIWHKRNTKSEENALSVVRCSRYAPSTRCIVPNNAPMLRRLSISLSLSERGCRAFQRAIMFCILSILLSLKLQVFTLKGIHRLPFKTIFCCKDIILLRKCCKNHKNISITAMPCHIICQFSMD